MSEPETKDGKDEKENEDDSMMEKSYPDPKRARDYMYDPEELIDDDSE